MSASNINFTTGVDPSITNTIDLSGGDVTTNTLLIGRIAGFAIEAINFTGNGSPSWSLKATNVDDINEVEYYTPASTDVSITDSIINRKPAGFNYLAIEIKVNNNSTGSVEFIYTPIS